MGLPQDVDKGKQTAVRCAYCKIRFFMEKEDGISCRENCGACCIAPSISSPIPGMPNGKKAGERCIHLDENMRCKIFHDPARPRVCASLKPSVEMCGSCRQDAMDFLAELEELTRPEK